MLKPTTNLQSLLTNNRLSLANIYRQCQYHAQLEQQVKQVIDPLVNFAYIVGQYKNNLLAIYVEDHSQGEFLRLHHYAIINDLKTMPVFADLLKLRVVVDPSFLSGFIYQPEESSLVRSATIHKHTIHKHIIHEHTIQLIKQSASRVRHPDLAQALDALAITLEKNYAN